MRSEAVPRGRGSAVRRFGNGGFSLLELLIVIGIILVLAAFALPQLLRALRRYQTESTARNIASIILRARSEAVKLNRRIGTAFAPASGTDGNRYGIDENGNGVLEPTEPVVMAGNGLTFWNNNSPTAPPATNLPVDYSAFTVPAAPATQPAASQGPTPLTDYNIVFSPQGTVLVYQGSGWVLAPQVQGFGVTNATTIGSGDTDSYLISITPAGRVRLFFWQNGVGWEAR